MAKWYIAGLKQARTRQSAALMEGGEAAVAALWSHDADMEGDRSFSIEGAYVERPVEQLESSVKCLSLKRSFGGDMGEDTCKRLKATDVRAEELRLAMDSLMAKREALLSSMESFLKLVCRTLADEPRRCDYVPEH
ncbi:hypothetical protein H257_05453 [Aphanomyces astaci]|uniref:Uncharacterized protein n=1 Tax=Aphanomyces astaci TaxID=112090 RepID=W4GQ98_APHAT|nr:hypothetical protein H257_05453 [Aphanomyces astaci]ETV81915.1 hypothetical protein H257_05453 [Aphanomyces astaci]RQM28128.1 hypothetical protein B5M09_007550 [Aphanomyces astaci]|eukprot:XP_009828652.1 hypothetical protein H257_05453 [Aphanomyces astaci]